jgi:hypothetical protein
MNADAFAAGGEQAPTLNRGLIPEISGAIQTSRAVLILTGLLGCGTHDEYF